MRIGLKTDNDFIAELNKKNSEISRLFLNNISHLTKPVAIKTMLGDSTVSEQKTFDPMTVYNYFKQITNRLPDWSTQDVSISNNEDMRRIFTKCEIREGNYLLSLQLSLQYHVLLFYKPDNKVISYQKELSEIIDKSKNMETQLTHEGNQLIIEKLRILGYRNLNEQNLFELFFENDELREKICDEIEKNSNEDLMVLAKRKLYLLSELDNLLIETYQTTPVLIDDAKLVSGEEGCLCIINLEFIKNKIKEGLFDPKKIPLSVQTKILKRFDEILQSMEN